MCGRSRQSSYPLSLVALPGASLTPAGALRRAGASATGDRAAAGRLRDAAGRAAGRRDAPAVRAVSRSATSERCGACGLERHGQRLPARAPASTSCSRPRSRATPRRPSPSIFGDERLTYAQLDARANQLAHCPPGSRGRPRHTGGSLPRALARSSCRAAGRAQGRRRLCAARPVLPGGRLAFMLADTAAPVLITPDAPGRCSCPASTRPR